MPPPPPPPPKRGAAAAPPPPPPPAQSGVSSTRALVEQANTALRLRDEQLQASVRYYNSELETNAELDAITAQVVADLKAMARDQGVSQTAGEIEIELIQNLRTLLDKLLGGQRSGFLARKLEEVQRRITQLFVNSELYVLLAADGADLPAATWPEQSLYFALKRCEEQILAELNAIPVANPAVREEAVERYQAYTKQLCTDFLGKTTPELERLLSMYREVLSAFFREEFPKQLGEFCWEVVRESRVAHGHELGYKIKADRFHQFREVFDRKFLVHLVLSVQQPINERVAKETGRFRDATLRFVADPRIHTLICGAINDALYDYLHGEGFLDLPPDWRRLLRDR